jgi:hypothetical protein
MSRHAGRLALVCALMWGTVHAAGSTTLADRMRQAARPAVETPTAALSGTITGADDQKPLARARVTVQSAAIVEPRVTITGADGSFEFQRLPAGTYRIAVSRTGYVGHRYGEDAGIPAKVVTLGAGQHLSGIAIPLARAGVLVGTVLDEDDQPLASAIVHALVSGAEDSRPTLVTLARAETDDRGNFRLAGLPEGRYYVSAFDPAFERVGDSNGPLRYAPTYYPGVALVEKATAVAVTPGIDSAIKAVFRLRVVHPARVKGRIHPPDQRQLLSAAMIMSPIPGDAPTAWQPSDVRIMPNGSFVFSNVPPGRYQIRGRGEVEAQGMSLFASFIVTVDGRDVENIDMVLQPGATMEGTLIAHAVKVPKPTSLAGLRVRAPFADGSSFGDAPTGDVRADGTFRIRGTMAGTHRITLEGLRYPWVLESVRYRERDIIDQDLEASGSQRVTGLEIRITDVATEVGGIVRDAAGTAVPNALVLVSPAAPRYWTPFSRYIGTARTDATGRYLVRGLPAGDYLAVASLHLDESDADRREILKSVARDSSALSLTDRETRALDLTLTPLRRVSR